MAKIDLTPTYYGLWISEKDFAPFQMWEKEKGIGKIWEVYHGNLIEADVTDLKDNGINFSFIKKYKNQTVDLLNGEMIYTGINEQGLIKGGWEGKNQEGKIVNGIFHLAKNPNSFNKLKKGLGELYFCRLEDMIKNEQRACPFIPIF